MLWIAIEDADTHEVSDFRKVSEERALDLMDSYRVDTRDAVRFRLQDEEGELPIEYEGVVYKGGFGYNLWVASKYIVV